MARRIVLVVAVALFLLGGQGCTYQAWYAGLQERQRQECYKLAGSSDTSRCLDEVQGRSYDTYKAAKTDSRRETEKP